MKLVSSLQFSRSTLMAAMGLITVLGGITILALAADSAVPKNDPARGLIYDGLKKPRSGPCAGIFEFKSLPGQCTSGPTPFPRGVTAKTNATPAELAKNLSSGISAAHSGDLSADTIAFANEAPSMDWPCSGNSTNQKLIEMVYVYKAGAPNHFNQYKSSLELMAKKIEGGYVESARLTSNTPIYARFETDAGCNLVFRQISVPNVSDGAIINSYLKSQGFNSVNRRYLAMVDTDQNPLCGLSGQIKDDQAGSANLVNSSTAISVIWRPCWATTAPIHELEHTLGAVQSSAPNYSSAVGGSHCTDNHDPLCEDGSPIVCHSPNKIHLLDCNSNDYFRGGTPVAGSYLSNHWNTADAQYLERSSTFNITKLTRTTLTNSPPMFSGNTIYLSVTVSGGCGPAGGNVRFYEVNENSPSRTNPFVFLGSEALNSSNRAEIEINNLSVKPHQIAAIYDGNANCYGSMSNGVTQTIKLPSNGTAEFRPKADAEIRTEDKPSNFGTLPTLTLNVYHKVYLKFNVSGVTGNIKTARLRLFANDGSNLAGLVAVAPSNWTESGVGSINWNNAPPPGPTISFAGAVGTNQYVDFDVTGHIPTNGSVTLVLTTNSNDGAVYKSRETPPDSEGAQIGAARLLLLFDHAPQAVGTITTVAGLAGDRKEDRGFAGDGGPAKLAMLNYARSVDFDSQGNYYIADTENNRIRKVDKAGKITTIAGTGERCPFDYINNVGTVCGNNKPAINSKVTAPIHVRVDSHDNINILAQGLEKVDPAGTLHVIAGAKATCYEPPNSACGWTGPAFEARFNATQAMAIDLFGNDYIGDNLGVVHLIDTALQTRIKAGVFTSRFNLPPPGYCPLGAKDSAYLPAHGIAVSPAGEIYFASHSCIVKLVNGNLVLVAGAGQSGFSGDGGPATQAQLIAATGLNFDRAGNLYFGDFSRIRKIDTSGKITTIAGTGKLPDDDFDGTPALQTDIYPYDIALDPTESFILIAENHTHVRKLLLK